LAYRITYRLRLRGSQLSLRLRADGELYVIRAILVLNLIYMYKTTSIGVVLLFHYLSIGDFSIEVISTPPFAGILMVKPSFSEAIVWFSLGKLRLVPSPEKSSEN
jgi:hypothetical protein